MCKRGGRGNHRKIPAMGTELSALLKIIEKIAKIGYYKGM